MYINPSSKVQDGSNIHKAQSFKLLSDFMVASVCCEVELDNLAEDMEDTMLSAWLSESLPSSVGASQCLCPEHVANTDPVGCSVAEDTASP